MSAPNKSAKKILPRQPGTEIVAPPKNLKRIPNIAQSGEFRVPKIDSVEKDVGKSSTKPSKEEHPEKDIGKNPSKPTQESPPLEHKLQSSNKNVNKSLTPVIEQDEQKSETSQTENSTQSTPKKERRPKLVVLDIDGFMVERQYDKNIEKYNTRDYDAGQSDTFYIPHFKITVRPNLAQFWEVLFSLSNDDVSFYFGIWSCSNKFIFEKILPRIIPEKYYPHKFLFIWDRNMCELDPDFEENSKIESHDCIKKLDTILKNPVANKLRKWRWDETEKNILIIDDSEMKLRFNPEESKLVFSKFEKNIFDVFRNPFFEVEVKD